MPGASVVYLVRHGESVGNVNPAARRKDDPPLTDRGRAQATRAAAALARTGLDLVFSSPLRRARETADAIFSAWLAGDRRRPFPEGEDFPSVVRRVQDGLREAARARAGARIAIVT